MSTSATPGRISRGSFKNILYFGDYKMTSSYEYVKAGPENLEQLSFIDPVDKGVSCCLPGNFMNCPELNGSSKPAELCPLYMSQRCSTKWDKYCDVYYNNLVSSEKDQFIRKCAETKYCKVNSTDPTVSCGIRCNGLDPTSQSSPGVCDVIGTQSWRGTPLGPQSANYFDIGDHDPIQIKPLYLGRCPNVCDVLDSDPESLGPNDTVLNEALKRGSSIDVLIEVAQNAKLQNKKITNPYFLQWINANTYPVENTQSPATLNNVNFYGNKEMYKGGPIHSHRSVEKYSTTSKNWMKLVLISIIAILIVALFYYFYKKHTASRSYSPTGNNESCHSCIN